MRFSTRGCSIFLSLLLFFSLVGCRDSFDAKAYTQAVLDLNFQGDSTLATQVSKDANKEELSLQYQEFIADFVEQNITGDLLIGDIKEAQFKELTGKIFALMRYNVTEAEKTGGDTYKVLVEIWPANTFIRFKEYTQADAKKLQEKKESGEYVGTAEEVNRQILQDATNHAYELLYFAYQETEYGEKETVTLEITKNNDTNYTIIQEDMNELMIKILQLDEMN